MPYPSDNGLPFPVSEIYHGGFADYNDAATAATPISITAASGYVKLTNDGQGVFTNKQYLPQGVSDIWDSSLNEFTWLELNNGDMVDIRLDITVTTTAPNQQIEVDLFLASGEAGEYSIPFVKNAYKTAGAKAINRYNGVYMGDDFTRLNPAEFRILSDGNASVVVNGWYCKVIKLG